MIKPVAESIANHLRNMPTKWDGRNAGGSPRKAKVLLDLEKITEELLFAIELKEQAPR